MSPGSGAVPTVPTRMTTTDGRVVTFGAELGRGGEGVVLEVTGQSNVVSKVYLSPITPSHAAKIDAMVRTRTAAIEQFAAWPVAPLLDAGSVRGFLMPRVPSSFKAIHTLYGPKSRASEFPGATWAFLGHVAMNVCRAFAAVHAAGHVVGDVNHDNVRVDSKGLVRLIDCDSFQVDDQGRRFRCRVGVPTHTPPELQGRQLDEVDRLPEHDAFGLAVVLFQLLLMGRHPFAGRYRGPGEMSLERAISQYRFAYGPGAAAQLMEPPPNSVGLDVVPPRVAELFRRAFEKGPPEQRPRPEEWLIALDELRGRLVRCDANATHFHLPPAGRCPWCSLEARAGVSLFGVAFVGAVQVGSFRAEDVVRRLTALGARLLVPAAPRPESYAAAQPPEVAKAVAAWNQERRAAAERLAAATAAHAAAVARVNSRKALGEHLLTGVKYAAGGAALSFCCPPLSFVGALLVAHPEAALALGVAAAVALVAGLRLTNSNPPGLPSEVQVPTPPLVEQVRATLASAESEYATLLRRHAGLHVAPDLEAEIRRATALLEEHKGLAGVRERRLADLGRTVRERQLNAFLATQRIESASISNIGPGRKATLRSYGIETAADISERAVGRVHGFGDALTWELMAWRQRVEGRFRFDASRAVSSADLSALDADIARTRAGLERDIAGCLSKAEALRKAQESRISAFMDEMARAAAALANARATAQGIG